MSLPAHIELDMLVDEHAQAVRRLEGLERAPSEGRVADPVMYKATLFYVRRRVEELALELRVLRAEMEDGA